MTSGYVLLHAWNCIDIMLLCSLTTSVKDVWRFPPCLGQNFQPLGAHSSTS